MWGWSSAPKFGGGGPSKTGAGGEEKQRGQGEDVAVPSRRLKCLISSSEPENLELSTGSF